MRIKDIEKILNFLTIKNQNLIISGESENRQNFIVELSILLGVRIYVIDVTKIERTNIISEKQNKYKYQFEYVEYILGKSVKKTGNIDSLLLIHETIQTIFSIDNKLESEEYFTQLCKNEELDNLFDMYEELIDDVRNNIKSIILFDNLYTNDSTIVQNIKGLFRKNIPNLFLFAGSILDKSETKNINKEDNFSELFLEKN